MPALETPPVKIGWKAYDFLLKGTDGKQYSLKDVRGPKGLVVMFICNHCPFVQAISNKIALDMSELQNLGIGSVAIMPNSTQEYPEDSLENMIKFKQQHNFNFPYVLDPTQKIARSYDAVCTPDFFGFDHNLTLQYRGRLDAAGMKQGFKGKRELFDAMKLVAETGHAPSQQNPSIGCSIKWSE